MRGRQKDWISSKTTVAGALAEAGVKLGPKDEVFPDLDQRLWDGIPIFVCRVRTTVVARDAKIAYGTTFEPAKRRLSLRTVGPLAGVNTEDHHLSRVFVLK